MKKLRWILFLPWLAVVLTVRLLRGSVVLVCGLIAWLIKWALALVVLVRHGSVAMDTYLEGCR